MAKTPDTTTKAGLAGRRRFRVAYALNNEQPVRCSYISDQPLFYMDFEGDHEFEDDMGAGDPFGIAEIEEGVAALQAQIEAMTNLQERFENPGADIAGQFIEDMIDATSLHCEFGGEEKFTAPEAAEIIRKSRLGSAYLNFAAQHKVRILATAQVSGAQYDRLSNTIQVNPELPEADQILLLARELRRVWQHRNGALVHPLSFHPDQAVLVNRAQTADLAAAMVRLAWELQLADRPAAWERLENSSMSDLAHAFAREAYIDFRTLNNGRAASAVFESWFLSERCRSEDRRMIQQMLSDYQGYVFDSESASRRITADLILALGSMPFGKNYLAPYVTAITTDPVFTEIRDRSNANFLWFIKFERSFREAEQELQGREDKGAGVQPAPSSTKKERLGEHEKENIVSLPGGRGGSSIASCAQGSISGGNIVAFTSKPGRGR